MSQVAEGVTTCAIARTLARERNVRTPITDEVHAMLYEGRSPAQAVETLMTRDVRPERD